MLDWHATAFFAVTIFKTVGTAPTVTQPALAIGAIVSPLVVLTGVIWSNINTGKAIKDATTNVDKQIAAAAGVAENARLTASTLAQTQIEAAAANARLQAQAGVVSNARLRWIDAIRDDVADLLASSRTYAGVMNEISSLTTGQKNELKALQDKRKSLEHDMQAMIYKVELRLTKGKEKHDNLIESLRDLIYQIKETVDYNKHDRVLSAGRDLFYSEWKRLRDELGSDAVRYSNDAEQPKTTPPLRKPRKPRATPTKTAPPSAS